MARPRRKKTEGGTSSSVAQRLTKAREERAREVATLERAQVNIARLDDEIRSYVAALVYADDFLSSVLEERLGELVPALTSESTESTTSSDEAEAEADE